MISFGLKFPKEIAPYIGVIELAKSKKTNRGKKEGEAMTTHPPDANAVAKYPIAVVKATTNAEASKAFMEYVLGPDAQKVLAAAGFGAP